MPKSNSGIRRLARVLALSALVGPSVAGAFEFLDRTIVPGSSGGAASVAVGDMDGDGRDDVAFAGVGHKVRVFRQLPTGGFAPLVTYELQVSSVLALRFADIDGDGAEELLVGHSDGLAVRAADGSWRYLSAGDSCVNLAVADIDLDGSQDMVCHTDDGYAVFHINDGQGGFSPPVHMATPLVGDGSSKQVQIADVSGDGLPDLVMAGPAGLGFYVHRQDGEGGFLPADAYPSPDHIDFSPGGIEVLDIDRDGVPEIITTNPSNRPEAALHVYRRDVHGQYRYSEDIATYDIPVQLLAHDVDGDGIRDLFVMHRGWDSIGHYMGGRADLVRDETVSTVGMMWVESTGYALGDVNGDACTDLAAGTTQGLVVLYGVCSRRVVHDFDGDGVSDIFWRNQSTGANLIWPAGDSNGAWTVASVTDRDWKVAGVGDFDGDGHADVFWRHGTSGANAIWRSADSNMRQVVATVPDQGWQLAGVGDFDGDGRSDLLWRHAATGMNAIWKSGDVNEQRPVRGVTDVLWQVAGVGDFDGDGRSDILWRHAATGMNVIWNGGEFRNQRAVTGVTNTAWRVAGVGDFDGDGRSDVLWRHGVTGANVIWASADHGIQRPVTGVTNLAWQVVTLGDYDGDGRADILWRMQGTGRNAIWLGGDYATQLPAAAMAPDWTSPH